jgi:hypothetical protein
MDVLTTVSVEVEAIAKGYRGIISPALFYPTMEGVERELVTRLRAAADLDASKGGEDF